ncbi:ABC transporter ATP-binding protein [Fictibacillus gelatini]|uniref:ABC transporter ATP-binding protein n=1 Tax=Fictibacillus gelatini TaxID=225985 RepID=UPI0004116AF1|nr:ABC transporter ATP-binding protein [Fictibacillus gelatini]
MEGIVAVQNVSKHFGDHVVLNDLSLTMGRPEIFGLLGPSGSGKTTLVKMIAGIDAPSSGTVSVFGEGMPNLKLMGQIGYMAQADALYEELTAKENLEFFASLYGLNQAKRQKRIVEVMEMVSLKSDLKKMVKDYSGGMKRRLSLAIALLHEPKLLILDEPTVGIDPVLRKAIWDKFESLRDNGTAILVTTHVMDEAERCDRLGLIRDGEMIATGEPGQLKRETNSSTIEEAFLFYGGAGHAN